jgi:hypothetical protein
VTQRKKLIEVALPLDAINKASAREKSIRHGHPSTLHLWWARRPLAAARAVLFAQMVDDPSAHPDLFPTAKSQEKERLRLFKIIEDLVLWENTTNEAVLQKARDEIWQSWRRACAENADHPRAKELFDRKKLPAFHDPFAGGGALPLEAQRLRLESYASDLNPVAVLINKAMIEIPPRFAGKPPVNPESRAAALGAQASRLPFLEDTWRSRDYLPHIDSPGLIQSRFALPIPCLKAFWTAGPRSLRTRARRTDRRHASNVSRNGWIRDTVPAICGIVASPNSSKTPCCTSTGTATTCWRGASCPTTSTSSSRRCLDTASTRCSIRGSPSQRRRRIDSSTGLGPSGKSSITTASPAMLPISPMLRATSKTTRSRWAW